MQMDKQQRNDMKPEKYSKDITSIKNNATRTKRCALSVHRILIIAVILAFASAFTLCAEQVSAATNYSVWVGGTQVTSDNCNKNATWKYDPGTKTLTLNGYSYSGVGHKGKIYVAEDEEYSYYNAGIYANQELHIVLKGTNTITCKGIADDEYETAGIWVKNDLTIDGSGTLTATGGSDTEMSSYGICVFDGDMTLQGGTVNANGGADCASYGLNSSGDVYVKKGTLNAKGGTGKGTVDDEPESTGMYVEALIISDGTVNATGGAAANGSSTGCSAVVYMTGGTLKATGGKALSISAGVYGSGHVITGGSAVFTGGTCTKGSYGVFCEAEEDIEIIDEEIEESEETQSSFLTVGGTARVTAKGNTAANSACYDYLYNEAGDYGDEGDDEGEDGGEEVEEEEVTEAVNILLWDDEGNPYCFDDNGQHHFCYWDEELGTYYYYDENGEIHESTWDENYQAYVFDNGDDDEDEPGPCQKIGDYYIYYDEYAPVVTTSANTSGSSAKEYIAPDPALDLYTKVKYVSVRPAVLPTGIELSQDFIKTGSEGSSYKIDVSYTPADAEVKCVRWSSADNEVATVDEDGTVTIQSTGETVITASFGTISAECSIVCDPDAYIQNIFIEGEETQWIHAADKPLQLIADIEPWKLSKTKLKWTSSDPDIASVDETGCVTGHEDGTVTITAKDPEGEARDSCTVKVHLTKDISEMEVSGISPTVQYTGYNTAPWSVELEGLERYDDYTITAENAIFPGTATVVIEGTGDYHGTKTIQYEIEFDDSTVITEGTCGEGLKWYVTQGRNLLIMGSGSMVDYTAHRTTGEAPWNDYMGQIDGIWIGEGCTSIGNNAFSGLYDANVYDLYLPDSITAIGDRAFCGDVIAASCQFRLPANLQTIGAYAFAYNEKMRGDLAIPDTVTSIGKSAFEGCGNLDSVSLGKGMHTIKPYTFADCTGMKSVDLPDELECIEENAFRGCTGITTVTFPATLESIEKEAFRGCTSLTEAAFMGNAPEVGADVFKDCSKTLIITHEPGTTGWDQPPWTDFPVCVVHEHDEDQVVLERATTGHQGRETRSCSICGIPMSVSYYERIASVEAERTEFTYSGKAYTPKLTVSDAAGKTLVEGEDFDVVYTGNTNAGTGKATAVFKGRYEGSVSIALTINKAKLKKSRVKLSATKLTYTGKVRKPKVKMAKALKQECKIKYSKKSSKKIGTYKVTVTGKGNYTGKVVLKYQIIPTGAKLKSVKPAKKSIKVTWKKQYAKKKQGRATGYQIQIATDKKFKKGKKTVNVKGWKKTTKTIKKLKSGKRYYTRVRTYKKVLGKKYYSKWSKVKRVRTK